MNSPFASTIALVGDADPSVTAHVAIPRALDLAATARATRGDLRWRWLPTDQVLDPATCLNDFAGFWLVPASPYRSFEGALAVARFAREQCVPFLGTCGGFQHALIEFARNVVGWTDADHAESNPSALRSVIAPLSCSLVEANARVRFTPESLLRRIYAAPEAIEGYHCRYGLNERFREPLEGAGFRFTAMDEQGDVRGGELPGHPFFVGTLFQPERRALQGEVPALAKALVDAVVNQARLNRLDPATRLAMNE